MSDLHFMLNGEQHYIRVRPNLDTTERHSTVYEGLIDGREYVFFEVDLDDAGQVGVWSLFERAIAAYRAQCDETEVKRLEWRND